MKVKSGYTRFNPIKVRDLTARVHISRQVMRIREDEDWVFGSLSFYLNDDKATKERAKRFFQY